MITIILTSWYFMYKAIQLIELEILCTYDMTMKELNGDLL